MSDRHVAIEQALQPGRFFLPGEHALEVIHCPRERIAWEIHGGHLLDQWQTRQRCEFEAWNIVVSASGEPQCDRLLSVKYDAGENKLYVVRYLLVHGWQPLESSPGVIESRPVRKEMPELVGTIDLTEQHVRGAAVFAELSTLLYLAVVGTSRLPITSLESPLPAFSLGKLMYLPQGSGSGEPLSDPLKLIRQVSSSEATLPQKAKLLEVVLRAADLGEIPEVAKCLVTAASADAGGMDGLPAVLRTMLNDIALSPYTGFATKLIRLLDELARAEALGAAAVMDVVSYLLRHLTRHLTAYDLTTFHNLGANYPDALLLDTALKMYLHFIERRPDHFASCDTDDYDAARRKRVRRRALRQACLLRQAYEGHRVPDVPTSPGDNQRVLPEPYGRVPEEQITQPLRRRKQLYAGEPLSSMLTATARRLLGQSVDDLHHRAELEELGAALFLDRPLGIFKQAGEVDRTPLLSYHAFSREIATRRLRRLHDSGLMESGKQHKQFETAIAAAATFGYPATQLSSPQRQGVVCLEDARLAAADFVFFKTGRRSLKEFCSLCDWSDLTRVDPKVAEWLRNDDSVLLIRTGSSREAVSGKSFLTAFDRRMQPQLEMALTTCSPPQYRESRGVEFLRGGLRVSAIGNMANSHAHSSDGEPDNRSTAHATGRTQAIVLLSLHRRGEA